MAAGGVAEPTVQATTLLFTTVTDTTLTLSWTNGDGATRIVLAKSGGAVDSDPVDETTYAADAAFGSGDQLGTGNYVLFNGSGNSVDVTGLTKNTTYHFRVFELNGGAGAENYFTDTASGNPASQLTEYEYLNIAGLVFSFASLGDGSQFDIDGGNAISVWRPEAQESGGAWTFEQSTGIHQPILGGSTAGVPDFDGSNDNFDLFDGGSPGAWTGGVMTIVAVAAQTVDADAFVHHVSDNAEAINLSAAGVINLRDRNVNTWVASVAKDTDSETIIAAAADISVLNNDVASFKRDSNAIVNDTATNMDANEFGIDTMGRQNTRTIAGNYYHLLLYDVKVTDAQLETIVTELNSIYSPSF
jgi:hypothetical protein